MEIASKSQAENGADNTTIMTPLRVKQSIAANGGGGGGGTSDYDQLQNRPQINSITLTGNKTSSGLGLQDTLISGTNIKTINNQSLLGSGNITVGGGTSTDVQVNGTSITSGGVANILTQGAYSSSNKIATMSDLPSVPTKTSDLTNDGDGTHPFLLNGAPGYISSITTYGGSSGYARNLYYTWDNGTVSESHIIANYEDIPTKVSDLQNDSGFITGMTILSYGSSTWQDFISAYNANKVVYCRASSNSNPATGSQNRLAFMAYVNNATSPTEVEFQYYRSVATHTAAQQGDQVYVYKLNSSGTWTVTIREASSKVTATGGLTTSFASDTVTVDGSGKQETLVSGTNIKTINNQSILGSGNIDIQAGGNVQSDWNQTDTTADDYIKNKPTIPTVNDATLTIQQEGVTLDTFTANSATNATVNIVETDPIFSDSAASAITEDDIEEWSSKQDALVSGTNIKTINNASILGPGNLIIGEGGVMATDVEINGNSITSDGTANIAAEGQYDETTNKLVTQSAVSTAISNALLDLDYISYADESFTNPILGTTSTVGVVTIQKPNNPMRVKISDNVTSIRLNNNDIVYIGMDDRGKTRIYSNNVTAFQSIRIGGFAWNVLSDGSVTFGGDE